MVSGGVVEYQAAQTHNVNDSNIEQTIRNGLDKTVAAVERRQSARSLSSQQLSNARTLMSVSDWDAASESCQAALSQELLYEDTNLTLQLVLLCCCGIALRGMS